jgi:hypothetical protein
LDGPQCTLFGDICYVYVQVWPNGLGAESGSLIHLKLETYYNKTVEANVTNFNGDNCAVYAKLAKLADKAFIGCAKHRLTLEVNRCTERQPVVQEVLGLIDTVIVEAKKQTWVQDCFKLPQGRPRVILWNALSK